MRGRVTYTYLILYKMFETSQEVMASMLNFVEVFKRRRITYYPGENVLLASFLGFAKVWAWRMP